MTIAWRNVFVGITVLLLASCGGERGPQKITFFEGSWEEALAAAKAGNKYIYLDAVTEWCGPCKEMDAMVYSDPEVAAFVHEHFIPLKRDIEKEGGAVFGMKYRINVYPTHLVFDSDGNLRYEHHGGMHKSLFVQMLRRSLDPDRQLHLAGVSPTLDIGWPRFFREQLLHRKQPSADTLQAFWASHPDWTDEVTWSVIYWYGIGDTVRNFIMHNRGELESRFGAPNIHNKLETLFRGDVNRAIRENDEVALDSALARMGRENEEPSNTIDNLMRFTFYKENHRWRQLVRLIEASGGFNNGAKNGAAWAMYQDCDDQELLTWAAAMMEEVVEEDPEWQPIDTYAALLWKTGRYAEARVQAQRALDLAKANGELDDATHTKELLAKIEKRLGS